MQSRLAWLMIGGVAEVRSFVSSSLQAMLVAARELWAQGPGVGLPHGSRTCARTFPASFAPRCGMKLASNSAGSDRVPHGVEYSAANTRSRAAGATDLRHPSDPWKRSRPGERTSRWCTKRSCSTCLWSARIWNSFCTIIRFSSPMDRLPATTTSRFPRPGCIACWAIFIPSGATPQVDRENHHRAGELLPRRRISRAIDSAQKTAT